jgi:uncharacterized OsmC-like protein
MSTLKLTYDGDQHATALREPHLNTVAIDCPITAKGDEFSPGNLLGISVAGCMLLSMGVSTDRLKMERAAELCPIKHSFGKDTTVTATFIYAAAMAA